MSRAVGRIDRRPIIGVMGSHTDTHTERAREIGVWIAQQGYHLLTGGGDGVMGAVTKAFVETRRRSGVALGVVPAVTADPLSPPVPGYPNRWVEIPICSHLDRGGPMGDDPMSRNHINVLTSTVVILLPGGSGTASEARLAVRYGRPCVGYLRSPDELPGCPPEVPVERDFARVAAYVAAHVARAPDSGLVDLLTDGG